MKSRFKRVFKNIQKYVFIRSKLADLNFSQAIIIVSGLLVLFFQIFAFNVLSADNENYQADIKIDFSNDFPIMLQTDNFAVKIVDSKYEMEQSRQKAAIKNKSINRLEVLARSSENRPEGVSFAQKRALAQSTAQKYGIDWKILEAVWQVESGKSWDTSRRSYAGATGPMQFMPGTFRAYAEDGDGDGQAVITDANDALASAAKMLSQNGLAEGNSDQALYNYNHSLAYVNKVKSIANSIGE
ncbi:MAG: lytic transglycosylase catalytic subunit [Candidatus Berkelbacteria bacterium Licking1014_7]|uniref:Lytic transglycosylase catalytic subunit n=1 Tax=Candidatus Berkelbacteria bacterium Licking1014_7 TaxID=2017147 RepID=A0A554LIF8_9BACT|nr:MAG: lytic transglycosylase catalytic subunit [Candidatus Berkelbacteria bacterium Licking1014_7]